MEQQRNEEVFESLSDVARYEQQAFENHKRQYMRENPPPRKPPKWRGIPWMMVPFAAIAVAGSLLSAFRTAPVFIEIAKLTVNPTIAMAEGLLAMIAIDMAVVAYRFIKVVLDYKGEASNARVTNWVTFGFWFAFFTQLIAQVYAVREIATMLNQYVEWLELAIALAAALSGMVLAFVTGEIMAVLWMRSTADRERVLADYQQAVADWADSMRRSWSRKKATLGIETPAFRQQVSAVVSADTPDRGTNAGETVSPSVEKALTWLMANPDAARLSVREIADLSGINRDAVNKARRRLTASVSENGNHNGTH